MSLWSSFWPTRKIFINFACVFSIFDKRRICSRSCWLSLWASSIISSAFLSSEYVLCKKSSNWFRKSPLVSKSMLILNSLESSLKKSKILRSGSGIDAIIASVSISFKKQFRSVVFPVPISPVSKRKPLFSWIPYFKEASASLCFSLSQINLGSGLCSKGLILKL